MKNSLNKLALFLISMVLAMPSFAEQVKFNDCSDNVLQNVKAHKYTSLNGSWQIIADPFDAGYYDYRLNVDANGYFKNRQPEDKSALLEYSYTKDDVLMVPGDWNTQDDKYFFYESSIWYKKHFNYSKKSDNKQHLYFAAVNYLCQVYLNGEKLGEHVGGFTPFSFDVTDKLKEGDNFVVVRVNNERHPEGVPTVNSDWWNYGGITRDVMLVETSSVYIDDYLVQLKKGDYKTIEGFIQLNEELANKTVELKIAELKINKTFTTDAAGCAKFSFTAKPKLWSDVNPKLYDVKLSFDNNTIVDKIGFRQIETRGKAIFLNGKQTFLRGISIHEEAPFRQGRVTTKEECRTLLNWAKELGCNFVRLAHYPHNEEMVRMAEEMGFMIWSEIPVYWTIHWENPTTYANASTQLNDMIQRDKNRCGIIIWSIANETPHSDARDKFLTSLVRETRAKDNTRLISMAMEKTKSKGVSRIIDNLNEYVDIISFNNYLGWYGGKPEDCATTKWIIDIEKPVFVSEFGGGALQGYHGARDERWTEEYQEYLYEQTIDMYKKVDGFSGTSPWILVDFRSARRQNHGVQDFFNRKGLISERGQKKKAFYTLQKFYKEMEEKYNAK